MTQDATVSPGVGAVLPGWRRVLAVVAHPDDETFGLGAVLDGFRRSGTTVSVLCLTRGERGVPGPGAAALRTRELDAAARVLGVARTVVLRHPDGDLAQVARHLLADEVIDEVGATHADGLLVFDTSGVTGHLDHAAATSAALLAAAVLDLPVLGWTLPRAVAELLGRERDEAFSGRSEDEVDLVVTVDRARQLAAVRAHASQARAESVVWRRLELLGDTEHLRWLFAPRRAARTRPPAPSPAVKQRPGSPTTDSGEVRAVHRQGDRFDLEVRQHVVPVDQPESLGGEDTAASPTELFVAGIAGCVGFYVRRYLTRHRLPTEGLAVSARYELGTRPARVTRITVEVTVPRGVPDERREGLLAVARHCTLHNTLDEPPEVTVGLTTAG